MAKNYHNNAVIGNSSMLGCIGENGELLRLFWPNIDYPQHIDRFCCGLFNPGKAYSTTWLDGEEFTRKQHYISDTNILETVYEGRNGLRVVSRDFILPDRDIMVRRYEILNNTESEREIGFMAYSSAISTNPQLVSTLFDFESDALIHYRHGYYIAVCADRPADQFQIGNNAFESAKYSELGGYESIGMSADGAASWKMGNLQPGCSIPITLYICASDSIKGAKSLVVSAKGGDPENYFRQTMQYWHDFIGRAARIHTGIVPVDELYNRSLLVFGLMYDKQTGGLLAAPEVDEEFTRCGRYAYCWGRDAAFITAALDRCGLTDVVDGFYRWAAKTQDEDGSWQQRYHMDGNLAPCWGLQIDETGTVIWGILKHYETAKNKSFLHEMWDCVRRGTNFLSGFIDEETGLPAPSYDLWEERVGEHAYSAAAVWCGIGAGMEIASILGYSGSYIDGWAAARARVKTAVADNLWHEEAGRFIRSVRVKLNPWGSEHTDRKVYIKVNPKGFYRDFTLEDRTVDISLLGLTVPFDMYQADDPKIKTTSEIIERALSGARAGGLMRYENDGYIGGNPWVIATLWSALYHIKTKNYAKAREYLEWASNARTGLGLLPEQVDKDTGRPAWVIPLTWSHAMYVLTLAGLIDAGAL